MPYGRIYQSDFPITSLSLEFSYYSEEREIFLYLDFTGNIVGYPEKLISSENWDLLRFKQGIFQEFNSSTSTPEGFLLSVDEISINNSVIPEPLTILGTLTGLGFGIFFKQKSAKHK